MMKTRDSTVLTQLVPRDDISLVVIATQTEEYLVGDDTKGEELLQLVSERVHVKDKVTEAPQGQKTIRVSEYKLVPQ